MLNHVIRWALHNRLLVVAGAVVLFGYGLFTAARLPIDVLPDLNRPRVTIFLEANGLSPEEIETQIVLPVETALNGAPGVLSVRSSATVGLGLVYAEFGWETDNYRARQLVTERLANLSLPEGVTPALGPISSIMGQIMMIAVTADSGATATPADLRTLADFTVRRRLMAVKGVSQVIPIGGDRLQYQVLVSSAQLKLYNLGIGDVEAALHATNRNTSGGFFDRYGSEVLIRNVGRANSLEDLRQTVVSNQNGQPVLLGDVAEVRFGAAVKRGDGSFNARPAVILTVEKQPGANTLQLTEEIESAVEELRAALPPGISLNAKVFQQKYFIEKSLSNVEEALRDGFVLVTVILLLFLMNLRTTVITLTAIPLSLVSTAIIFQLFGLSVNTLTLGGLAIAIGELVDDAIVDVENVFRRLRENRLAEVPKPHLTVIFEASSEVRNAIVYATIIVVLVFLPLFAMQGIEGRIFAPLGLAYITSILASLVVSLTLTPALCSFLLKNISIKKEKDSALVRFLKKYDRKLLHFALEHPRWIVGVAGLLVIGAGAAIPFFGTEFLPPFNEGTFTINLSAPPGTSLEESNKLGTLAENLMLEVPGVAHVNRRTGRAELDEHVEPVSNSEIDVLLDPDAQSRRNDIMAEIRQKLGVMKGVSISVGQPISHRLDHLLSGVRAQVAIKIFGEDLTMLRLTAGQIKKALEKVPGAVDIFVERQVMIPQLSITVDRNAIRRFGMQTGEVADDLAVLLNGKVTGQILDGQKSFDILLRTTDAERSDLVAIRRTLIPTPDGGLIPLEQIAKVEYGSAVNTIQHENTQRRIVVSCNVEGRDLGSTVADMKARIAAEVPMPQGYYLLYGGQHEAQREASFLVSGLSLLAVLGIFLVLFMHFRSFPIVLQIMLNIPLALVGSVVAVALTGGTFSVATMVGFVTLTGIASRNGIMMISHYQHLMRHEGEVFGRDMIIRGSLERLVPVLMTALVAALALVPLTFDPHAAGKEILYPVATVILGGLLSSTLLDMVVTPAVFFLFGKNKSEVSHTDS